MDNDQLDDLAEKFMRFLKIGGIVVGVLFYLTMLILIPLPIIGLTIVFGLFGGWCWADERIADKRRRERWEEIENRHNIKPRP